MKLKDGFIKHIMGDKVIIVSTGDFKNEFNGMVELNNTAADILDWLLNGNTFAQTAQKLSEKYDIEFLKAKTDTDNVIKKLLSLGILEDK